LTVPYVDPKAPLCALGAAFLAAVLLAGCWTTKDQGDALRRDVDEFKKQLHRDINSSNQERKKLQEVMEQATVLLTRNSADVGAQVDRIQAKADRVGGQLEEQQKKLDELGQQFTEFKAKVEVKLEGLAGGAPPEKGGDTPTDKDELYRLAQTKLAQGDHKEARRLARHFISTFPTDGRAHTAQLMLGDSYYMEQKFAPAIVEYKEILEKHKKSPAVPDALYKIGMSFYQLKFCADAEVFLSQLIKKHRRSKYAVQSKKVLGVIRKFKRDKKVCR